MILRFSGTAYGHIVNNGRVCTTMSASPCMVTNFYAAWLHMSISGNFCLAVNGNFASSATFVNDRLFSVPYRCSRTYCWCSDIHLGIHLAVHRLAVMTSVSSLSKVTFGNNIPGWATAISSKPAVIVLQVGFCQSLSCSHACALTWTTTSLLQYSEKLNCAGVVGYY